MTDTTVKSWNDTDLINVLREMGHKVEAPTNGHIYVDGIFVAGGDYETPRGARSLEQQAVAVSRRVGTAQEKQATTIY